MLLTPVMQRQSLRRFTAQIAVVAVIQAVVVRKYLRDFRFGRFIVLAEQGKPFCTVPALNPPFPVFGTFRTVVVNVVTQSNTSPRGRFFGACISGRQWSFTPVAGVVAAPAAEQVVVSFVYLFEIQCCLSIGVALFW